MEVASAGCPTAAIATLPQMFALAASEGQSAADYRRYFRHVGREITRLNYPHSVRCTLRRDAQRRICSRVASKTVLRHSELH